MRLFGVWIVLIILGAGGVSLASAQVTSPTPIHVDDLIAQIRSGERVEFDHVRVECDLNETLDFPRLGELTNNTFVIIAPIKIVNSVIECPINPPFKRSDEKISAIISVKIVPGFQQIQTLIDETSLMPEVNWVRFATGPDADILVSVSGINENEIAQAVVKISSKPGVEVVSSRRDTPIHFQNIVNFSGTTFERDAFFVNSTFDDSVNFSGATFNQQAHFGSSIFNAPVIFDGAHFTDILGFDATQFHKEVTFRNTAFNTSIPLVFVGTEFKSDVIFVNSNFANDTIFLNTPMASSVDFSGVEFKAITRFEGTTFGGATTFSKAIFGNDVIFASTQSNAPTSFQSAIFQADVSFESSVFDVVDFYLISWHDEANFNFCNMIYTRLLSLDADFSWVRRIKTSSDAFCPAFAADVFARLETNFREQGRQTLANEAYYYKRVAECDYVPVGSSIFFDCWLGKPFGYLVRPARALAISIGGILLFGICLAFLGARRKQSAEKTQLVIPEALLKHTELDNFSLVVDASKTRKETQTSTRKEGYLIAIEEGFAVSLTAFFSLRQIQWDTASQKRRVRWIIALLVFAEWIFGYYMLVGLALTLANTLPVLEKVLSQLR